MLRKVKCNLVTANEIGNVAVNLDELFHKELRSQEQVVPIQ